MRLLGPKPGSPSLPSSSCPLTPRKKRPEHRLRTIHHRRQRLTRTRRHCSGQHPGMCSHSRPPHHHPRTLTSALPNHVQKTTSHHPIPQVVVALCVFRNTLTKLLKLFCFSITLVVLKKCQILPQVQPTERVSGHGPRPTVTSKNSTSEQTLAPLHHPSLQMTQQESHSMSRPGPFPPLRKPR